MKYLFLLLLINYAFQNKALFSKCHKLFYESIQKIFKKLFPMQINFLRVFFILCTFIQTKKEEPASLVLNDESNGPASLPETKLKTEDLFAGKYLDH